MNKKIAMDKMMINMANIAPSANLDADFLKAMMPHHQGAIESSKSLLKYSKYPKIRAIAEKIISDQEKEIENFLFILNTK
ncbi:MAG: DUF305 domain-containing protein [Campylobacter sp.]|nr:DUF305 domain-containing protein [Campylobacter sp.]